MVVMAQNIKKFKYDKEMPEMDFELFLNQQVGKINDRVKDFMIQVNLFNKLESRVVKEFLLFLSNDFKEEFECNPVKPSVALDRYWFMFKELN